MTSEMGPVIAILQFQHFLPTRVQERKCRWAVKTSLVGPTIPINSAFQGGGDVRSKAILI